MSTSEIESKLGDIRDICQAQLTVIDQAIHHLIDPDLGLTESTLQGLPVLLQRAWVDLIRAGDLSISLGLDLESGRSGSE